MFQVDWSPTALAVDLCQIYLDHASQRKDITVATDRIEARLRTAANSMGTELSAEGLRKLRYDPLEVIFSVYGINVEIQTVRWVGFRSP